MLGEICWLCGDHLEGTPHGARWYERAASRKKPGMLTISEIQEVLERHSTKCLDNKRERTIIAAALFNALRAKQKAKR